MLSLTLKEGDFILIGDNIRVQFLEDLSAKSMRIGIEAPKSVNIVRSKPYEKALTENAEGNSEKLQELALSKQKQAAILKATKQKEKQRKEEYIRKKEKEYAATKIETIENGIN